MMLLTFFVLCCFGGHLDTEESFDLCLVAGEVVGPAPSNRHYSHDDIPSLKVFEFSLERARITSVSFILVNRVVQVVPLRVVHIAILLLQPLKSVGINQT